MTETTRILPFDSEAIGEAARLIAEDLPIFTATKSVPWQPIGECGGRMPDEDLGAAINDLLRRAADLILLEPAANRPFRFEFP